MTRLSDRDGDARSAPTTTRFDIKHTYPLNSSLEKPSLNQETGRCQLILKTPCFPKWKHFCSFSAQACQMGIQYSFRIKRFSSKIFYKTHFVVPSSRCLLPSTCLTKSGLLGNVVPGRPHFQSQCLQMQTGIWGGLL